MVWILRRQKKGQRWWPLPFLVLLLTACATTPVGVVRVDPQEVHRELTRDVLSSDQLSTETQNVLQEQNLAELFDGQPEAALARLHAHVAASPTLGKELFALAELSFLHAERSKKPSYHLAAAIYAYAFIFPNEPDSPPDPLDVRLRVAADLYNLGVTAAFKSADGLYTELRSGTYELPFGEIAVSFDESSLRWAGRRLTNLVPVAELKVRGLKARYRQPGIGAPLAATPVAVPGDSYADDLLSFGTKVPVTAFLRLERPRSQLTVLRRASRGRAMRKCRAHRGAPRRSPKPLAKLLVVDSGSRLWDASFTRPLDELEVSEATRELLRRTRFVEPVPFVQRVIFLATPHRGSYLTLNRASEWIAGLIKLPFTVMGATADLLTRNHDAIVNPSERPVTSLDQMNPRSRYIQAFAAIPIAPGVQAHSIIAVKGDGPAEEGDDGVVKYASAHIDGVDSELVVRSDHSVQWAPEAIEEVRRILLLHAAGEDRR